MQKGYTIIYIDYFIPDPKNGTCPPLDPDIVCDDEVINTCYIDAHCNGDDKCCYDGCKAYCRSEGRIYTKGTSRVTFNL